MNPVFLRELRQAVRNRLLMLLLCIYLTVLILTIIFELRWEPQFMGANPGQKLFNSVFLVVFPGTLAVVLLHTIIRCAVDRINEDPMFFSLIPPARIVRGRMLCSLVLSGITYAVALPFFTLVHMFRGLDFGTMLFCIIGGFWLTQTFNAIATAFFIGVRSWLGAVLHAVPFLFIMLVLGLISVGLFHMAFEREPWFVWAGAGVILGFLLPMLAYWFALAQVIPASADRLFPLRRGITILAFLIFCTGIVVAFSDSTIPNAEDASTFFAIESYVSGIVLFSVFALVFACERSVYPLRQREDIPENGLLRRLRFPFSSGVVNGLVWLLTMEFLWVGALCSLGMSLCMATTALFIFNYATTTRLLWALLLKRWVPRSLVWLLAVAFVLFVSVPAHILQFSLEIGSSWPDDVPRFLLAPSPFWQSNEHGYNITQIVFAFLWAFTLLVVCAPITIRRFREYRRPCLF
ncbi:MAG TPA: hypothetical protein DEB39_13165 [Planctomycetaceae bacterium]|nr:hypothetical protein [Planctomycetaceae bacterium]